MNEVQNQYNANNGEAILENQNIVIANRRIDHIENVLVQIIKHGNQEINMLNQGIRNLNGRVNGLRQENFELQNQVFSLENEVNRVEYELDKAETERKRDAYYSEMKTCDNIMTGITIAGGVVSGPLLPLYLLTVGLFKYTYNRPDLNSFKAYENQYLEEHPGCLKSEAFAFASQKLHEAIVAFDREQERSEMNQPCVDISY